MKLDGRTTDRLWYEVFSKEKSEYNEKKCKRNPSNNFASLSSVCKFAKKNLLKLV